MTAQRHLIFWALAFSLFMTALYVFNDVLLPFVLGMVFAYLLNRGVVKFSAAQRLLLSL